MLPILRLFVDVEKSGRAASRIEAFLSNPITLATAPGPEPHYP